MEFQARVKIIVLNAIPEKWGLFASTVKRISGQEKRNLPITIKATHH